MPPPIPILRDRDGEWAVAETAFLDHFLINKASVLAVSCIKLPPLPVVPTPTPPVW